MNATDHIGSLPLGTRIRWSGGGDQMHEGVIVETPAARLAVFELIPVAIAGHYLLYAEFRS